MCMDGYFIPLVINCGCLENPGNGSVSFTDTTYSSTATYSCNTGYTLTAENEMITCLEVGNWSGSTPTCSGINLCVRKCVLVTSII